MIKQALSELIKDHFEAVEAKDLDAVLDCYHTEAEFLDPHYPNVHMKGKDEIREGLTWGFKSVKTFSFMTENYFENEDKTRASVEMVTKLELSSGQKSSFTQVFIVETKEGEICRCQAYETYGPHGMHNIMLKITRILQRLKQVIQGVRYYLKNQPLFFFIY